eukprot:403361311
MYLFRVIFCNWQQTQEEYGIEYFIKEKAKNDKQTSLIYDESRTMTLRRTITKKYQQSELEIEIRNLWGQVQNSIGKYSKLIDYISKIRISRENQNVTNFDIESGRSINDTITKYVALKELTEQIQTQHFKQLAFGSQDLHEALYRRPSIKKLESFQSEHRERLMSGYEPYKEQQIRQSIINPADYNSSEILSPIENSFDQLRLEDEVDEIHSKWANCKNILDPFKTRTNTSINNTQGTLELSHQMIFHYFVNLYEAEIVQQDRKADFDSFLTKQANLTFEDQKYLNQINEQLFKKGVESYSQQQQSQNIQSDLKLTDLDLIIKTQPSLEKQSSHQLKVKFQQDQTDINQDLFETTPIQDRKSSKSQMIQQQTTISTPVQHNAMHIDQQEVIDCGQQEVQDDNSSQQSTQELIDIIQNQKEEEDKGYAVPLDVYQKIQAKNDIEFKQVISHDVINLNEKSFGGGILSSAIGYISYKFYDDYSRKKIKKIRNLKPGERAAIEGRIRRMDTPKLVDGDIFERKAIYTLMQSKDMKDLQLQQQEIQKKNKNFASLKIIRNEDQNEAVKNMTKNYQIYDKQETETWESFCLKDGTGEVCFDLKKIKDKRIIISKTLEAELQFVAKNSIYKTIMGALSTASYKYLQYFQSHKINLSKIRIFSGHVSPNLHDFGIDLQIGDPSLFRSYLPTIISVTIIGAALSVVIYHTYKFIKDLRLPSGPHDQGYEDEECPPGQDPCVVCLVNKRKIAYDCGHLCTCFACDYQIATTNNKCPNCRIFVNERRQIYQ